MVARVLDGRVRYKTVMDNKEIPVTKTLVFRPFSSELIPEIETLQLAYQNVYPKAAFIPGQAYLSVWFDGGKNVICAIDNAGKLKGYAVTYPNFAVEPEIPHTFWTEIRVDPALSSPEELKDLLLDSILDRISDISSRSPEHESRIVFQYNVSEEASIDYILSRGGVHSESIFKMRCDLSREIPLTSLPAGIEIQYSHMENETEQEEYVDARNEAFPRAATTLADWQHFLHHVVRPQGTMVMAYNRQQLIGSATIHWDEGENQKTDEKAGTIQYIFVRDKWRRKGIATFMIHRAHMFLRENMLDVAQLEVYASNRNALTLYERAGYVVKDESRQFVLDNHLR